MTDVPEERQGVHEELEKLGTLGDGTDLSRAECLEVLGRLHTIEVERFYDRRRIEWRLAFTLWVGLIAAGALVIDNLSAKAAGWAVGITIGLSGVGAMSSYRAPLGGEAVVWGPRWNEPRSSKRRWT